MNATMLPLWVHIVVIALAATDGFLIASGPRNLGEAHKKAFAAMSAILCLASLASFAPVRLWGDVRLVDWFIDPYVLLSFALLSFSFVIHGIRHGFSGAIIFAFTTLFWLALTVLTFLGKHAIAGMTFYSAVFALILIALANEGLKSLRITGAKRNQ